MAKTHGSTYIAGLWKEDLQVGLIWYVVGIQSASKVDLQHNDRLQSPSWSWASHWGKIIGFRRWENNHNLIMHESVQITDYSRNNQKNNRYPGSNPFVDVRSKSWDLTGYLRTAIVMDSSDHNWKDIEYNDLEGGLWVTNVKDPVSGEIIGQIALDSDPAVVSVQFIHCLLCTVREKGDKWQLTCLGLVPTDLSLEEYTRVGLVFIRNTRWFGKLDEYWETIPGREWVRYERDARFRRTVRLS